MKDEARQELDDYLKAADGWATDRESSLARSRLIAWRVAGGLGVVAVLEACAMLAMAPLKTVQPYTLLVDRHTGYVEALDPLDRHTVSADAALTRSFLVQYVIARGGFAIETVQTDYHKVALWSVGQARQQYIDGMQPSNPASPLAIYPRSTVVEIVIKSVSSLSADTALVRFDRQRLDQGRLVDTRPWTAVIRFAYSGRPMSVADRLVNPLGFEVLRYSRSEDIPPEPSAVSSLAAPAASASGIVPLPPSRSPPGGLR